MRKLAFGFLGLLLVGVIYYFTLGKTKLITEVKQQVETELSLLQKEGFTVANRKVEQNKEYFELSLTDTKKALAFFNTHGVRITPSDIEALKGSKLGIGLEYLPDTYTSVAMDMTPLNLPLSMTQNVHPSQKKSLAALQKLLDKKALHIHIAMNKLGNGFKGYIKDINETLETEDNMHLLLHNLTFTGKLKKQRLHTFTQKFKTLSIAIPQAFSSTLHNLTNTYTDTKKGYDNQYVFSALNVDVVGSTMQIKDVTMHTITTMENNLATIDVTNKSKHIKVTANQKRYLLDDVNFTSVVKNLDISAFETLQTIDPQDKEQMNKVITQLLSHGVSFSIPTLSVGYLTLETQKLEGFVINSHINIDKDIPVSALQQNPISALSYVDANLKVSLSSALMTHIMKEPRAMLAMMMFQPKDVNGKKVYQVELKNGKALLNGKPIF